MSIQETSPAVEAVLQVWERGPGNFGGRVLRGAVVRRRLEGCTSADGVKTLAIAFGERVDRVENTDPVPWHDVVAEQATPRRYSQVAETFESDLIECLLRLNTGQRKRLLNLIARRPFEERVQLIEHCNDLAAAVSRTMLDSPVTR